MAIQIGEYNFEGPYDSPNHIEDQAGVYAVLDRRSSGQLFVLDIGIATGIRSRLLQHDRADCWQRNCQGRLQFAAMLTPGMDEARRRQVEQQLRARYDPVCGVR